MKFNITAGSHKALVDLELDGKGGFSGLISSSDFGTGKLGGSITGDHLTGAIELDGHAAKLSASISGETISGTITAGWFFSQDFTGTIAA